MQNTDAMLAFYRGLGLQVAENAQACSVYIGNQMINFHRHRMAARDVHLARSCGKAPCGDLCSCGTGHRNP